MFFFNVKSKYFDNPINVFLFGIFVILLSFFSALLAYYTYVQSLLYFSFVLLVSSIGIFFLAMTFDLYRKLKSFYLAFILSALLFVVYFYLRLHLHHFDFFLADASDYYLSGLNSITNHRDMGFFLPLTAAMSAVGFKILGYDYAPFIMVLLYASVIPLSYFIMQFFLKNSLVSLIISLLIIVSPLAIWFPKSTYSESLWQIQLLILIVLSYHISTHIKPNILSLLALMLSMLLLPFTRGEATLLYAVILFLAIFHIWKFRTLTYSILTVLSLIFLDLGVHFTLQSRAHYLLTWQYHRIIPNVTEVQLMAILYGFTFAILLLSFIVFFFKHIFKKLNIFILITVLALISKVAIAYIYMHKSNPLFHSFDLMNEYGFASGNFGLPLTLLIVVGLILLHYKAIKGDIMALVLVIFYAIFYLPFAMQAVRFEDIHEIFLYWNRYYFSLLMIIHLYALGITLVLIYNFVTKVIHKTIYYNLTFIFFITVLFLSSLNFKLIALTIEESYLENSQKLMPWVSKHIGTNPLSIIYDETINYKLHHNRSYDAKILTYRTFPVARINTKKYIKVNSRELKSSLKLDQKTIENPYLLCLSKYPCKIDTKDAMFIDSIILPISWRENYGIAPNKDTQIHHNNITQSIHHSLILHASLYKLREKFEYGKEILFKKSSSLSSTMLNHQWQFPKAGIGALTRDTCTKLLIQNLPKKNNISYEINLKCIIFGASVKSPQALSIQAHNHILGQMVVTSSAVHTISFTIPNTLLSYKTNEIELDIQVSALKKNNYNTFYKLYLKSIKTTLFMHEPIQKALSQ